MKALRIMVMLIVAVLLVAVVSVQAKGRGVGRVTTKVLVRGAPIHGTNGLAFDDQGRLYIASAIGREIVVMDPQTGKILERYGQEDGVVGPDDLIFGPDGSLYWTEILSGEVGRRTPDGVVTKQFVAPFVNPITFSDDGRLFVAQAFVDDGLYEVDPDLVDPPVLILGTGNPAFHLNAFDFGPDGKLYAPRQQLNQIVRIDVDTKAVEILTDQFEGACKFDSQGRLHVGTEDRVVRFDPATKEVTTVATLPGSGLDNIAFDSQDRLFTSNFRDGSIHAILPHGRARQLSSGGLMAPQGIAVLPDDHAGESLYVADFWTMRNFDGLNGRAGLVGADFFFDSPFTASADGENLVLTSWFGNTVEVWNPTTHQVLEVHSFATPLNAIRFQDDLVVAELGTGSVVSLDTTTGVTTTLAAGLPVPTGLAAKDDDLWVAEWATGTVWQIVADGKTLDTPLLTAADLTYPEGLAVDHDGTLLVVESGLGRLSRIDPATGVVSTVTANLALGAPGPAGWPPTWLFNGVAVGERGDIYVTGDIDNVIYRIKVRP
jgi:sugar lactone lactonase YvrE